MTKEKLQQECKILIETETIESCQTLLDIYSEFFFLATLNHRRKETHSKEESDAKMICQMMLTKMLHLKSIISGVEYQSKQGVKLNKIIDPTIVSCLVRNLYETVCMFQLIFCFHKTNDEKKILYNLWISSGLKYRQRFAKIATTEENKTKAENDKRHIEDLVKEIEATNLFTNLSEKNQGKIRTKIKDKDYLIKFENNDVQFLSWQDLSKVIGIREDLFDDAYTYLSFYSHPSYVSVFQFASMFQKNDEAYTNTTIFNLKKVFILSAAFIDSYIKLFPEAITTFDSLPLRDQIVINFYSTFPRGQEYLINDSWKEVN